jgi:MFS transporter, DHA2 family, multidrug resistance protein
MELAVGTVAVSLATFMNVLDTTIANVSIPAIAGDMGVSPNQGTWVITSFAVANGICVPLTGWLTQRFGQVRLFTTSVLLFVLASLLCGLSSSLNMLIGFRVLQGLVAGPMIPLSQALLLQSFPRHKSGSALAAWSVTTLIAPVMGPILGGWLSDNLSWEWIFYINIPTGLLAAWLTWRIYRRRESARVKRPIDVVGLALLVVWVSALQIMLDKGRELDWFGSPEIVALAVTAGVGFLFFLVWELHDEHPVVDLSLFKGRNFAVGTIAVALGYGLFFGNIVLMPLWLQQFMGYTATWAGLVTAPIGILAILMSPLVGKSLSRMDPRYFATAAFGIFATVSLMRSGFSTGADVATIVWPQVVQGAAMATFFVPLTAVTLSGLPPHRVASASGLTNFARITAGAFGASISTTLWDNRAALHHARLTEGISPYNPLFDQAAQGLNQSGLTSPQALVYLERQINTQAYMLAADDFFWISAVLFVLLGGVVWLSRPIHGRAAVVGGGEH